MRNRNSGVDGRWVRDDEELDNEFYRRLVNENYSPSNRGNRNGQFFVSGSRLGVFAFANAWIAIVEYQ